MDEIEKKLVSYIKEMNIAKMTLSQLKGIDLESIEIQIALCKKLNIQNIEFVGLLDKDLTSEKMIDLLCDYDFKRPNIIGQIELDAAFL